MERTKIKTSGVGGSAIAPLVDVATTDTEMKVDVEAVTDFSKLTKEELITLVSNLTEQNKMLSNKLAEVPGEKDKLVEDINKHYEAVLDRQKNIISALSKRLSLIQSVLDLDKEDK